MFSVSDAADFGGITLSLGQVCQRFKHLVFARRRSILLLPIGHALRAKQRYGLDPNSSLSE